MHRLWEGFYQHKILRPQVMYFIQFITRSSTGVNVLLGGIYTIATMDIAI